MRNQNFVPQVSVFGPVLCSLFPADIPVCENVQMGTYADDTVIIATSENPANASSYIQKELSILEKWLKYWRIVINVEQVITNIGLADTLIPSSCDSSKIIYGNDVYS